MGKRISVDGCTGNDLVTDVSGNVYIIGSFGNSVDFDPGRCTYYLTAPIMELPQ